MGENVKVIIDKEHNKFKLSHRDINSISNSEYFRKTGIKWVLGIIIVALLSQGIRIWFSDLSVIITYSVLGVVLVWILVVYTRGQNKHRKQLWTKLAEAGLADDSEE